MDSDSALQLYDELDQRAAQDSRLMAEWEDALAQYLDHAAPAPATLHRARSWFLLERASTALGESPLAAWSAQEELLPGDAWTRLLESLSSCFEVGEDGFSLRDLWSGRILQLDPSCEAGELGDLWIGRLCPTEKNTWQAMAGASFFRSPSWLPALQDDLAELRSKQQGMRLSLLALETILSSCTQPVPDIPEDDKNATFPFQQMEDLFELEPEWNADRVQSFWLERGTEDLLELLAFETQVDLKHVQRLLPKKEVDSAPAITPKPEPEPVLEAASALQQYDNHRSAGKDLQEAFQKLESSLGLAPGSSEDQEEDQQPAVGPESGAGMATWLETWLWEQQQAGTSPKPESVEAIHGFCQSLEEEQKPTDAADLYTAQVAATAYIVLPSTAQPCLQPLGEFLDWCKMEQGAELNFPTVGPEWEAWCHRIRTLATWQGDNDPPRSWHTTTFLESGTVTADGQKWSLCELNAGILEILEPGDVVLGQPNEHNPNEFLAYRIIPRECHQPD